MNFLDAVVSAKANGRVAIDLHGRKLEVSCEGRTPEVGEHVSLAIRPEAMQLEALRPGSAAVGTEGWVSLPGVLREEFYIGTDRRYVIGLDSGETLVVRSQNSPAGD